MLEYKLSSDIRKKMRQNEPAVKAALCTIANAYFSADPVRLTGIHKYEGGVVVNKKDIVIQKDYVSNDWIGILSQVERGILRSGRPLPEEQAVVSAIYQVAEMIKSEGIGAVRKKYEECVFGDPLRNLLDLD